MPYKDPEDLRAYQRAYQQKHRDRIAGYNQAKYRRESAEYKAKAKARYYAKRERILAERRAKWAADPEYRRHWALRNKAHKFGVTVDQYLSVYSAQRGRCAICRTEIPDIEKFTHLDHDHVTGRLRGILCNNCNAGLGQFKDDAARLRGAIRYLKRNQ